MTKKADLIVADRKLQVSNLDKVLYPKAGFTKADVIDYYIRIAPVLLPHLKDRPLTMKRYPDGVEGQFFYEKNCPVHRPKWVQTAKVWSDGNQRIMHYCLANDLPTLVWAANLADLELHTSLSRKNNVERPTMMVFDLDPGAPADIVQCCQVGIWLRELLDILEHAAGPEEFLEHTKLEMFQDQAFCFTPKGDLIALPRGATPVDFAYAVHSEIGNTCVGAKVNGRIVPLRTR